MKRLAQPIWTFLKGYLISTNDTFDAGLETMVFPASDDARVNEGFIRTYITGVDFAHPYDEYTKHYDTVEEAKAGHKETVKAIKMLGREPVGE